MAWGTGKGGTVRCGGATGERGRTTAIQYKKKVVITIGYGSSGPASRNNGGCDHSGAWRRRLRVRGSINCIVNKTLGSAVKSVVHLGLYF